MPTCFGRVLAQALGHKADDKRLDEVRQVPPGRDRPEVLVRAVGAHYGAMARLPSINVILRVYRERHVTPTITCLPILIRSVLVMAANRAPIPLLAERRTIADVLAGTQRAVALDAPAAVVLRTYEPMALIALIAPEAEGGVALGPNPLMGEDTAYGSCGVASRQ